jgi:hypothetical protein
MGYTVRGTVRLQDGGFSEIIMRSRAKGGKIASIITAGAWAGARGNMEEHLEQSASARKSRATRTPTPPDQHGGGQWYSYGALRGRRGGRASLT